MTNHKEEDPRETLEKDPVWKLLLQARKPEASPFFARNVVREVRKLEDSSSSTLGSKLAELLSCFSLRRIAAASAFAAVIIAIIFQVTTHRPTTPAGQEIAAPSSPVEPPAKLEVEADASSFEISDYEDELEMIDYLDGLLAVQNVNALDDEALAELLF